MYLCILVKGRVLRNKSLVFIAQIAINVQVFLSEDEILVNEILLLNDATQIVEQLV